MVASGADEVGVDPSGAAARVRNQKSASAFAADDRALEVVMADPLLFAGLVVGAEDVLDALPGFRRHEWFMAAGVLDAAVTDDPFVVRVSEQLVQV